MKQEIAEVYNYTKKPTLENQQLVLFWGDGVGTYTPPGHWNAIAADDFIELNLSEVKWARNLALLNMSLMDAGIVCWKTKYTYYNPRPSQLDPKIKTLTGLPNFPSYISGHSTFSGAASAILGYLVPNRAAAYTQMANDASKSRLVGGLHYRADCEVGLQVGEKIGQYAINKAKLDGAN
jgi:membrane-associated phospholipid phosphatase